MPTQGETNSGIAAQAYMDAQPNEGFGQRLPFYGSVQTGRRGV
jgi:hypothetical protein